MNIKEIEKRWSGHYVRPDMIENPLRIWEDIHCLISRVKELEKAIEKMKQLALRSHYYCEDCWYTCPKHPEGSCNDTVGSDCNCGADYHNKKVEELYAILEQKEKP